ncbi:hypothetical protein FE810_02435 [Thalassotalea litorea]|uniref:DUF2946 domain-containing protein n=1 Tax=Thalassotalea litorea TaxID=2020715 RepID=A0A5R9IUY3_9GAMM|nr:hypothetical protein [Thalassotalea litorea]TLU67161.1 hypothetical protein FE810_02435 [Thalassotalea litorea]
MTAIITQNSNQLTATQKSKGWLLIGLFLLALVYVSHHQASHDGSSNHMHCQVCWQFAADFDNPGKAGFEQPQQIIAEFVLSQLQPIYLSALCGTQPCRGPPSQS